MQVCCCHTCKEKAPQCPICCRHSEGDSATVATVSPIGASKPQTPVGPGWREMGLLRTGFRSHSGLSGRETPYPSVVLHPSAARKSLLTLLLTSNTEMSPCLLLEALETKHYCYRLHRLEAALMEDSPADPQHENLKPQMSAEFLATLTNLNIISLQ